MDVIGKGSGLAIMFPRFAGTISLTKAAEDATTVEEVIKVYGSQPKRVAE